MDEAWQRDMEQRLALAGPGDTLRGMFIAGAVESVRALAGEEAARRCLEASGEQRFVTFFSYPVAAYLRVVYTGAWLMESKYGGRDEALRLLGRRSMKEFFEAPTGKALRMLTGNNPKQFLSSLPAAYQVSASYGKHSIEWTSSTSGVWTIKRDFTPYQAHEGVLLELLERMRVRNIQVRGRQTALLDSEYDISWK